MRREIFTGEHEAFRETVRSFIARDVAPYHEQWERDGIVSREYPVARAFADSRVQTIFGGTTEIMKEIIGRGLCVLSPAGRSGIVSRAMTWHSLSWRQGDMCLP